MKASTYHVVVASVKFVLLFDEEETIYEPLMFVYSNYEELKPYTCISGKWVAPLSLEAHKPWSVSWSSWLGTFKWVIMTLFKMKIETASNNCLHYVETEDLKTDAL